MTRSRFPRRLLAAVAATLAAVLLAGCVGIPTSGTVQVGGVIGDQVQPDLEVLPDGPTPGSDPTTLLNDFMQAVQSPALNFAIAKLFMTPEFAAQWDPNEQTTIRRGAAEVTGTVDGQLDYVFTTPAFVDERGRYFETPLSQQRLSYTFAQVDGEWRIASAPTGIVLTENSFEVFFRAESLYFFDPSYSYLVPDLRWVPIRSTTYDRVVRLLLEGPSEWLAQSLVTQFPEGTTLETDGVRIEGTTATVSLSADAAVADSLQLSRVRQQLAATLGVASVVLSIGAGVGTSGPVSTAVVDPQVDGAVLIGTGDAFGYPGPDGVAPVVNLSSRVVAGGADAATVYGQRVAAFRADGAIFAASSANDAIIPIDDRPSLLPPALDPFGFVWTVTAGSAAGVAVFGLDGTGGVLPNGLAPDSRVAAMEVSRDGTRLLLAMVNAVGAPELLVAGIVRGENNVPVALGGALPLLLGSTPVDAAWVDDTTVAVLTGSGDGAGVLLFTVGGPSASLGTVPGATQVVGGNQGVEGIRVLAGGEVVQPRGRNWQSSGTAALFLGVQQGRDR